MNKKLNGLLVAALFFGAVHASDSNNKTSMNIRVGRDKVPAFTTFHELTSDRNDDRLGGHLAATGFFARSNNGSDLGKNFGANGTDSIIVEAQTTFPQTAANSGHVVNDLLLHDQGAAGNTLMGVIKFNPKQTVYGVRFDYVQRLDKVLDGLFFSLNLPIVHVKNDINTTYGSNSNTTLAEGKTVAESISLKDLLTGKTITRTTAADTQSKLTKSKLLGNSKTGLGDLEANLGWHFIENDKGYVGINLSGVVGISSDPDSQYRWGARTDDGKWGLGGGADACAVLWSEKDQNFKLLASLQYKYLFEGTEKRTLGLKELRYTSGTSNDPILSQYYLTGATGSTVIQPLANISTLDVNVKAGSQINGIVSFAYNNGGLTLDFGYNLFWKEAENVSIKSSWTENKYGISSENYDSTAGGTTFATDGSNTTQGGTAGFIKKTDLDTGAAATQAQVVHKVFGGLGYTVKSWDYPVMVGTGVSYELPSANRDAAEGYGLWVKLGVAF